MAGMPVSTLRIWEQRYQAVGPTTTPTGHRLYTSADVERVGLLRQLTEQGHAIGSLAGLGMEQLQSVATSLGQAPSRTDAPQHFATTQIVVVGQAMARRLQRTAVFRPWAQPPQVVAVFDSLAEATQAATGTQPPIDLLLWQVSGLQDGDLPELETAQQAWRARSAAVAYRFAGAAARKAMAGSGAVVVREPADDAALGAWLWSLTAAQASTTPTHPWLPPALCFTDSPAPARRFDDASLTEFAGQPSGMACECPSHVAELLIQIAGFEAYCADCTHRSPADAELHAYLHRVAGAARVLFETALERVATAEGRPLPCAAQSPIR